MADVDPRFRRPYRWLVLAAYFVAVGVTQMLWLNFAPLLLQIQARYGVSELVASTLVMTFPLLYVLLSVPSGALIDAKGYRFAVGLGAIATAGFSLLRIDDHRFWMLLAGQIGIAVAQPFVVNGISKLVADWFDTAQGVLATGIGTMGMFVGMAVGMAATPPLHGALGLAGAMAVFSGIAIAAALFFVAVVRTNGAPGVAPAAATGFGPLLRNPALVVLFALSFLGLGAFNGLTTWLEAILAPLGVDSEGAGLVGGILIGGGIVGAVIIPLLSDVVRRRKPFLIGCAVVASACVYPLCTAKSFALHLVFGGALGFFFMPAFALLLDMSSQLAGVANAGAATSLLMLAGNAGGVATVVAMPVVKGSGADFRPAVLLVLGLMLAATALAVFAREPSRAVAGAAS